jgi:hypothetical protein
MGCIHSSPTVSTPSSSREVQTPSMLACERQQSQQRESEIQAAAAARREEERLVEECLAIAQLYDGFLKRCCEIRPGAYCRSDVYNFAFNRYLYHIRDTDLLRRLPRRRPLHHDVTKYVPSASRAVDLDERQYYIIGLGVVSLATSDDPIHVNPVNFPKDMRSEMDDVVRRLNELYYAPGMPGCVEAQRDFECNAQQRDRTGRIRTRSDPPFSHRPEPRTRLEWT